jgi:glycosyltransferase involved in cell wall biosynthesis
MTQAAADHHTHRAQRVRVLRVIARMNIGGPAHHVSLLSGRLDPARYETLLLTGSVGVGEGSSEDLAQRYGATREIVPGLRPELSPLSDLRALVYLMRVIRRFQPDVIHTHTAKAGTLGRAAAILTPGRTPLVVHTYHGHVLTGYFGTRASWLYRQIERILATRSDCLVGVSDATVDDLVMLGVAALEKFRTIAVGLELGPLLDVKESDGVQFREELGAGPDEMLATFVGRLVPIKRVDVLLNATAIARSHGARLRLAIVGDGPLRGALEATASELGLGQAVSFLGFRRDLPSIVAGTDLAVLSSDNEGTPVALIEAAAGGRAAIATDVGGVPEIVTRATGILVPAGDVRGFADALLNIEGDREALARMGAAARAHVRERFACERLVHEIDELYQSLLRDRRADMSTHGTHRSGAFHRDV